ncbi:hypothetical protein Tco_1458832 [Tanacetum coccineum]
MIVHVAVFPQGFIGNRLPGSCRTGSFPSIFLTADVGWLRGVCPLVLMNGSKRLLGWANGCDLVLNQVMMMISCTNKDKPLALSWERTPRLDSGVRWAEVGLLSDKGLAVIVFYGRGSPSADVAWSAEGLSRPEACYTCYTSSSLKVIRMRFHIVLGRIVSVKPKSADFPDSPWERYKGNSNALPHSPWELYDPNASMVWEEPHFDDDIRTKLIRALAKLDKSGEKI